MVILNVLIAKSFKKQEKKIFEKIKVVPTFKMKFEDRSIFENTSTKFYCSVYGKQRPKILRLFNDRTVSGKNFLVSTTSGNRQVLSIPLVSTELSGGRVTCIK